MLFERGQNRFDVSRDVGREVIEARVVNPASGVFQVKRVVVEPPQADEIMQELERDARQRIPEQDAGNDDSAFGWFLAGHYITSADLTSINTLHSQGRFENVQTVSISLPRSRSQAQPAISADKSNFSNNRPIHQIASAASAASTAAATAAPNGTATITPRKIFAKKNTRPNNTAAGTRAKPKTSTEPSMKISRCPMTSIPPTCCRPVCIQAGNS